MQTRIEGRNKGIDPLPLVSIISVNWNGAGRLPQFLDDLRNLDYPKDRLELVMHDNASSDGSQGIILGKFEEMKTDGWRRLELIQARHHPGLNQAYTNAFRSISDDSEFILHMDNDIRLEPDVLKRAVSILGTNQKVAVVGCNVRRSTPPYEQDCGAIYWNWKTGEGIRKDLAEVSSCDAILDCIMVLRRSSLNEFDCYYESDYYFFCLGSDLFMRLKKRGWDIFYDPESLAYNDTGYSTSRHSELTTYLCVRDNMVFHLDHNTALGFIAVFLRGLASALWHAVFYGDMVRLKAIYDGIRRKKFDQYWWRNEMNKLTCR